MQPKITTLHGAMVLVAGTAITGTLTTTVFTTDLTAANTYYDNAILIFTGSAANAVQARKISGYISAAGQVTVAQAFAGNPVAGDTFTITPSVAHDGLDPAMWTDARAG